MRQIKKMIITFLAMVCIICTFVLEDISRVKGEIVYVDRKADVVFVIDGTGSMGPYIDSVKTNLTNFISQINGENIDVRVKFVTFRDITEGENTEASGWYSDSSEAIKYLETVKATGGGDEAETMFDGIGQIFSSEFGFRNEAFKFCITLTDASTKVDNTYGYTGGEEIIQKLIDSGINSSVITYKSYFGVYNNFVSKDGGILANIAGDYSIVLKELADTIVNGVENLVVYEIYPTEGLVGTEQKVVVKATGIRNDGNFKVTVGGENVNNLGVNEMGFEFTTPMDLPVGSYDICVVNGTGVEEKNIGSYKYVNTEEEIGYKVLKINPATGNLGEKVLVTVTVDKINYADDFSVTIAGEKGEIVSKESNNFKFYVPTTLPIGTYDIVATNITDKVIGKYIVTEGQKETLPEITSLSPQKGEEGKQITVKAKVVGMPYGSDFGITVGGEKTEIAYTGTSFFQFITPDDLAVGEYDVVMTNQGETKTIGTYTVTEKPKVELPEVTDLSPQKGEEGKQVTIKAKVVGMPYGSDFGITVGGEKTEIAYTGTSFFQFITPDDLAVGEYDVVMTNQGETKTIGTYTVTEKPKVELPEVTDLSPKKGEEGKRVTVKAKVTGMPYGSDFGITVGGEKAEIAYTGSSFFKFIIPDSLLVGEYNVVMTNQGETKIIGTYTVTEKPKAELPKITLDVTSATVGKSVTVKAMASGIQYKKDFSITVGGKQATVGYQGSSFFKFKMPKGLTAGTYDVMMTNDGTTISIGKFTYTE